MEQISEMEARISYLETRVAHLEKVLSNIIKTEEGKMVAGKKSAKQNPAMDQKQVSEEICKIIH